MRVWTVLCTLLLLVGFADPSLAGGRGGDREDRFCDWGANVQPRLEWVVERAPRAWGLRWFVAILNRALADHCVALNQIQVIGSHNSYHVEPIPELIDLFLLFDPAAIAWEYTHPPLGEQFQQQGIRQIELDIFADPDGGLYSDRIALSLIGRDVASGLPELDEPGFKVLHVQHADFDSTCLTFVACLEDVKAWSDAHPLHLPIMILMEAKDESFFEPLIPPPFQFGPEEFRALDDEILSVFPRERILVPDDVRGSHATLEDAILTDGWPRLGAVRGKVMFGLDNGGSKRDDYRDGALALEGRLLFTSSTPGEPDAAFIKLNDALADETLIPELVDEGYVVRTRADADTMEARSGDTLRRDTALGSGAHWVSSDYAEPDPRFGTGYSVDLPDGLPARCNPVNAPSVCRDRSLE